jgi:Ca2+-binding RTX toxin-like protein
VRVKLRIGIALTVTLLALAAAGSASAAVFCVDHVVANCPPGSITLHAADLNGAFAAAGATGEPDTISIGAGTYDSFADNSDQNFSANATNPVTIVGAGRNRTTLTTTVATTPWVLSVAGPAGNAELSGLTIAGQGDVGSVLEAGGVEIHDIAVTGSGDANSVGVQLSFSNLRNSIVTFQGGSSVESTGGTGNAVEDTSLSGAARGLYLRPGSTATDVHRVTAQAATPLYVDNTSASIDDSLLLASPGGGGTLGVLVDGTDTGAILNAHNVTLIDLGGSALSQGILVSADDPHHATLNLDNSIVRGFEQSIEVDDPAAAATVAFTASDQPFGAGVTGTAIPDDPRFVDPGGGDYRLRSDSPLIDVSPMTPSGGVSTTDLDGNPRVVGPGVDLGAYEYQRRAPTAAAASAAPTTALTGEAITFTGSGSDPDHGDALTYSWSFSDGGSATGPSASHAFASPARHGAILTVTDPTGQIAQAVVFVDVAARPPVEPPPALPCATVRSGNGRANVLTGTPLGDLLRGLGGRDRLSGGAGDDCLFGGSGNDTLNGGAGADKLDGGRGNDKLNGGRGTDRYTAGPGRDAVSAADGNAERIDCGKGRDRVRADRSDRLRRCEKVKRTRR